MLHNDISNVAGVVIAFRFEDTLAIPKKGIPNKILSVFGAEFFEIDNTVNNVMEHIYRNTPYTCDLVIERIHYTNKVKKMLEDIPHSRIVLIDKDSQVTQRLNMGDINLYIDNNEYRRSTINSKYAIPLREIKNYITWRFI